MAAADQQELLMSPISFMPLNGPIFNLGNYRRIGDVIYFALANLDTAGFCFEYRCNTNAMSGAAVLGVTFNLPVVDPSEGDGDPGRVVALGITHKRLVSGTDDLDADTAGSTEKEFTVTTDATQGQVVLLDAAFVAAEADGSYAAGDRVLVKVRRKASDADNTHRGTVLIGPIGVRESAAT
jgi:hypothetical protein